jgi:hypothetical protein
VKRQEYRQRSNNSNNTFGGRGRRNTNSQASNRENTPGKAPSKSSYFRQNHSNQYSTQKYNSRIRTEETVDDIKEDIARIEKEIDLEIKEIRSLKL